MAVVTPVVTIAVGTAVQRLAVRMTMPAAVKAGLARSLPLLERSPVAACLRAVTIAYGRQGGGAPVNACPRLEPMDAARRRPPSSRPCR